MTTILVVWFDIYLEHKWLHIVVWGEDMVIFKIKWLPKALQVSTEKDIVKPIVKEPK